MKFLQKKGFTLVELIVVIAIIGVLAAILVPTMIGYTIKAKVTSADTTAENLRKAINNYLLELNSNEQGMKRSSTNFTTGTITVSGGTWTLTIADTSLFLVRGRVWNGTGTAVAGDSLAPADCAERALAITLANMFPEIENAYVQFNLCDSKCNALYICTETSGSFTMQTFAVSGWSSPNYAWDNSNEGICAEGYIVGTAPKLTMA